MRALLPLIAATVLLVSCQQKGTDKPVVRDAWVRLAAVPGRPAAGYFTLRGGKQDDRLVRVDSAVVKKIELHDSAKSGGMATMTPITDVPVAAGATTEFTPGSRHAMLFDVDPAITPGTAIPMLFSFASGAKMEVEAKTVPAGSDDMAGMHH